MRLRALGLPRRLPPQHSVEAVAFKHRYVCDSRFHPLFFSHVGPFSEHARDIKEESNSTRNRASSTRPDVAVTAVVYRDGVTASQRLWGWSCVWTPEQIRRFDETYGWMACEPTTENFCCIVHDEVDGSEYMSDPFVVYRYI